MNISVLNLTKILTLQIIFNILLSREIKLTGINDLSKLRNLQETFGTATLSFSSSGSKILVNTNDVLKETLAFYLKRGNELIKIPDNDLSEGSNTSSLAYDSTGTTYFIKNVSYTLINADDEIVVELKEKPTSLKGLFAYSQANKIILENFRTENVQTMEFMFLFCDFLTQLEISNLNTSRVTNMHGMFYCCKNLLKLDISKWITSNVENMSGMFKHCSSLTELDLSRWDTSSVTDMNSMFNSCVKLKKIDISGWITSKVENFAYMFSTCTELTELDLSDWDTSNIKSMNSMFINCNKLTKLDVSGWVTLNVKNMGWMFGYCSELNILDLSVWDTSSVIDMRGMFYSCLKLKELNIETFNQSQIKDPYGVNLILDNDDALEYCRYSSNDASNIDQYFLRKCSKFISFKKCGTCDHSSTNTFCKKTLTVNTENGSGTTEYITKVFHYLEEEMSLPVSERSCYWIADFENLIYFNETLINKYHYIQCDVSCKSCGGLDVKMCKTCSRGFYSLFNETSRKKKRCYNELTIDKHFYLYNSTGYKECPSECNACMEGPNEESVYCLSCIDEDKILFSGKCITKKATLIKDTLNYTYDELKKNKIYDFLSNYTNTYYANNFIIPQFTNDNITLTLYNVGIENMNNSYLDQLKLDIFKVNLSSCYEKVIKQYNINNDLVYGQVDFLDNSNRISYILYDPKTNKTINMDICDGMDISISKNIELTEEVRNIVNSANEQGYNVVDINDKFYNDICSPYTNINTTDITISDRITDIYDNNFVEFIYYDGCEFESFNISESNATVKCKTKSQKNFFIEKNNSLNINKLLDNFKFCDASNFYVVTCYKIFFSKKGQSNNYSNYIYYFIFLLILAFLVFNYFTGIKYLKNKLKEINYSKKFNETTIRQSMKNLCSKNSIKKPSLFRNPNNNNFPNSKNYLSDSRLLYINLKDGNQSNPTKKTCSKMRSSAKSNLNGTRNKNKFLNNKIILAKKNKRSIKNIGDIKKKENNNVVIIKTSTKKINMENQKEQKKIEENTLESKRENQPIETKKKKTTKSNTKLITEIDFNGFDFEEALKQDKRTFMQLYLSYIRLKHFMLYIMYDDYNIYTVKCILFIHSFGTHLCTNGLFFKENTMHQIYKDNGLYNFIYRLPLTLYSIILSSAISFGLKKLALTQNCIIYYKKKLCKLKTRADAIKKVDNIIKCFKIKITIFIVSIILTLVAYWFYIGCFCTVYQNTQSYLIKDSLIGFGLSMLYPFFYLLIAALFRIAALKKNYACLYRISKIFA